MFLRRRVPENGPLKAAVIGAGVFCHHHATKYKTIGQVGKDVELFAIADPSADMRAKAKAHHGCSIVADWRELLGKVDLVSVCSPATTRAKMVRAFPTARAHVLVEKPIATTMDEALELVELSRKTERVLSVGHQERFVFARTGLLDLKEIPLQITCWRQGPWTGRGDDVSVVLDLMIHDLDLVHTLLPGKVVDVRAEGLIEYGPHADESSPCRVSLAAPSPSWKPAASPPSASGACAPFMPTGRFPCPPAKNTTPRPLGRWSRAIPVIRTVAAARRGDALVTPEQAAQALETALWIEEPRACCAPAGASARAGPSNTIKP